MQSNKNTTKVVTKNEDNKKKRVRRRKNRQAKAMPKISVPRIYLSNCAQQYRLALTDAKQAKAPCIPNMLTLPSAKITVRNAGTFNVGTNGFGYILVNPSALVYNDGVPLASVSPALGAFPPGIITTNSSYSLPGFLLNYGAGGGITAGIDQVNGNSPFSRIALSASAAAGDSPLVKYRLVGCTVYATYEGTELNLSGKVITVSSRSTDALIVSTAGNQVSSSFLLRDRFGAHFVSERSARKTHFVSFLPSDEEWDLSYNPLLERMGQYVGNNSSARLPHDGYSLFLGVSGGTAGSAYSYEVVAHYEIIGPVLPSFASSFGATYTKSESDPVGIASVLNGINDVIQQGADIVMDSPSNFANKVLNAATNTKTLLNSMSYLTSMFSPSTTPLIEL